MGLWVAGSGVLAQEQTRTGEPSVTLEPMVVTATAVPTPLSQTSASVAVITRQQIEARQAVSVTELLRNVPGLHIDQPGARGSVSSVYIRGGDPNFALVLIDGIKVNDPTNSRGGSFDFSTLSTENIERIEIVRGPLSVLYGSEAMSGVINIITRQGSAEPVITAAAAGGSDNYVRTLMQWRGQLGEADYALSGSYLDNGEPVEGSEFRSTALQANLGVPLSDTMELRWGWGYTRSDSEAFPEASGGPDLAVLRDVDKRHIELMTLGITFTHDPFPWWTYSFQFGLYNHHEDVTSPGVAPGPGSPFGIPASETDATYWRYELTLQHVFSVIKNVRFVIGAQAQFEDGRSAGALAFIGPNDFELTRDTYAPFVELQLTPLAGLQVQGGVRVDLVESFNTEVSPRIGMTYTLAATQTTLRINWGEGFKVPSFYSLSDPIVGNPDLVVETSTSVDAGLSQSFWDKRFTASVTYFYNQFDHLIDFDPMTFQLVNRDAVTTQGVELSLQIQPLSAWRVTAQMTYLETDIKHSEAELRNRPRWRGGFDILWRPVDTLEVNLSALFVGDSLDFSVPTGEQELDAYTRVDLAMTWTLTPHWRLFLAVGNLFHADYEEAIGFPAPSVRPRGGVRATF
jgi:outer membrane cobalamin receptor